MNFLASVGGDDYKQLTTAILKQLMAKEVCLNYLSSYSFNIQI